MSDAHVTFDELAELAEGTLARRRAAEVRTHLGECEECTARAATLDATGAALRSLGPVTMPADVVARLDRALADADAAGGETVVPDLGAVRRKRRVIASWPYAAAASVAVIAAIAVGVAVTNGGNDHRSSGAATAADAPLVATSAPHEVIESETGQTYTADSLATLAPQLLGMSNDAARSAAGSSTGAGGSGAPSLAAPPRPLGAAPAATAPSDEPRAKSAAPGAEGFSTQQLSSTGSVPAPLRRYANSRSALLACAAYITDTPNAAPLAVDYARWTNPKAHLHRAPSLILVFEDPDDAAILDVYVVAPACDSASLRDFTEVPKG